MEEDTRATFRSHERLRRSADIVRARREGRKRVGERLILWAYGRKETPRHASRLGILVGRKNGPAVRRNLFKRRLREIFRLHKTSFRRGWDFLVGPKRAGATPPAEFPPSYRALRDDFLRLMKELNLFQV